MFWPNNLTTQYCDRRTSYGKAIASLSHQTPCPGRVEAGRWVVDLDAGIGGEAGFRLRVGVACKSHEDDREQTMHRGEWRRSNWSRTKGEITLVV